MTARRILLMAMIMLTGCKSPDDTSYEGNFTIKLVDAPADFESLTVYFGRISIHRAGASDEVGWRLVSSDEIVGHDIISLRNGVSANLVSESVPEGSYDKIRVFFEISGIRVDGVDFDVFLPSDIISNGLTLGIDFVVEEGKATGITFDFDATRSILVTGSGASASYELRPIIRVQNADFAGSIRGAVSPDNIRATISTLVEGEPVATFSLAEPPNNSFALVDLPEGTYDIRVSADSTVFRDTVLIGKTVIRKQITQVGLIELQLR